MIIRRSGIALAFACVTVAALWLAKAGAADFAAGGPAATTQAEVNPTAGAVKPVLAADPAIIAKLGALGDNEAVALPPATIVGEFNDVARQFKIDKTGPRLRNYCIKMVWAPERRRALYLGGNHGVPHKINDVWEHDLPANTWAMLYAPDPSRNQAGGFDDWVFKDGVLQAKSGAPAQVAHSWDQITYDPEQRAVLWMNSWNIGGPLTKLGLRETFESDKNRHRIPLWAYYPERNAWKPLGLDQFPFRAGNASLLQYVPELKGTVWYGHRGGTSWLYEAGTDKWKGLKPAGDGMIPAEMVSCYDRKNKVIVVHVTDVRGNLNHNTYHYDPVTNVWTKTVSVANDSGLAPRGFDANTVLAYDSANGVCLLYSPKGPGAKPAFDATHGLWAYDAAKKTWTKLSPKGEMPAPEALCTGYFDEARNVLVLIRDASTQVWAYRYKKAAKC